MDDIEVNDETLRDLPLPTVDADADKHGRGEVLVVGGTVETPGAVLLAGVAALRVGAGRLRIAVDRAVAPAVAVAVPEARVIGLPAPLDGLLASADAVLVGSGWHEPDDGVLAEVAVHAVGTVVVDAGALPGCGPVIDGCGGRVILLPNEEEAAGLGHTGDAVVSCRGATVRTTAPRRPVYVDRSGTLALATSGSGDVAAGAVAGLAARGADPLAAAVWGVRLHRRAADRLGPPGFLARELLTTLRAET